MPFVTWTLDHLAGRACTKACYLNLNAPLQDLGIPSEDTICQVAELCHARGAAQSDFDDSYLDTAHMLTDSLTARTCSCNCTLEAACSVAGLCSDGLYCSASQRTCKPCSSCSLDSDSLSGQCGTECPYGANARWQFEVQASSERALEFTYLAHSTRDMLKYYNRQAVRILAPRSSSYVMGTYRFT